jgi:3-hydroxybutyryl-CoA dehydrogenase
MSNRPFESVAIVGAGAMGSQIALQCAAHGYEVRLFSRSAQTLQRSARSQEQELNQRVAAQRISEEDRDRSLRLIRATTDLREAVESADLVIENAPEQLELKRDLFAQLDRLSPQRAVLATNSSSLRVSAIEDVTRRPALVVNMHFYLPVWQRTMVEIMGGSSTTPETLARVRAFVRTLELTPIDVRRESTGFVFNRVWRAIKKECLRVVDSGVASPEDVDRAWMIAFGGPIGPFGTMDMVGLDVVRDIEQIYFQESGDPSDAPPKVLLEMIGRGELGVKTGKGFYTYPNPAFKSPNWLKGAVDEAS